MTFFKPYLIIVKSLLFFLFDSIVLWGSQPPQHNKLKLVLLIRQDAIGDFVIWLDTAKEYRKLYPPEKYKIVLPPLSLLSKEQEKQMINELKILDFYPERKAA